MSPSSPIELGVVSRPHGVRGAFKVRIHNPESTTLSEVDAAGLILRLGEKDLQGLSVLGTTGEFALMRLESVSDRDGAERLRGARLLVPRSLMPLQEDEYFIQDLIGCTAVEGQHRFGEIVDVFTAGGAQVLVIEGDEGQRLVPMLARYVASVDLNAAQIELVDGDQWEVQ